ncbi:hypothetical protein [Cryptosporangium phraense]|uniref:Uncharacterized protein n=1 Tax=Cryptosporangium phraense TaxID=2593070 RepID=A0A545AWH9_9ACTN|nr:hypothetical protein [Cryptosporangium phraense]TQS45684.1 hypothetical protein FL583_08155 [Cryptosporangium phraense]
MTNPHDDLDTDPNHDALAPDDAPVDTRSPAEIAEDREERSVDGDPEASGPAVPKWVVPAVAAVLVFLLLAFPLGWTIWAAIVGAIAAAAVSYAFVFRL